MSCHRHPRMRSTAGPTWRRRVGSASGATLLVVTLTACGGQAGSPDREASDVDARFASAMTQHHAQTLQLLNLPQTLQLGDKAVAWTDSSRTERMAEIEELSALLREWGEDVPDTGLDHASEGDLVEFDVSIDGVLTAGEVSQIRRAEGEAFAEEWFGAFLEHERGALALAQAQVEVGADEAAVRFAEQDVERHEQLIKTLERLAE